MAVDGIDNGTSSGLLSLNYDGVRCIPQTQNENDVLSYILVLHSGFFVSYLRTNAVLCMYVCMVITYSRVWINLVRLPTLLVVS